MREQLKELYKREEGLINLIFGNIIVNQYTLKNCKKGYKVLSNGLDMFFLEVIPVTPNRFRPENKLGDQTFLHGHTVALTKIL